MCSVSFSYLVNCCRFVPQYWLMCYECQFLLNQPEKLIFEQNGKDSRFSGAKTWRYTLNIDSRTKRLRVCEATVINQTYKYSILNLVCEGLNSKYRSYWINY